MPGFAYQWLDRSPELLRLSQRLPEKFPYLLESVARGHLGSSSLLLYASGEALVLHPDSGLSGPGKGKSFFARLESWYQQERAKPANDDLHEPARFPFIGGWFIYLGYETAREIERTLVLPVNRTGLPDAIAHRCHGAIMVIHGGPEESGDRAVAIAESDELLAEMMSFMEKVPEPENARDDTSAGQLARLEEEDPERFRESVSRIHEYLLAGDVLQVNVSRPWTGEYQSAIEPDEIYRALRKHNPAPFAGKMHWQDYVMVSSSPERLVQIEGRRIQTRPIAGTRPRGLNEKHDRDLSAELIGNIKERAEHIMLIDMERNDLGRVCKPGTVEVDELMVVESYAHVHHIVSNVRGELQPDASPVDAIMAVFPGGTITGCPKVRCMEIIAELEMEGRGYYTGSMGYLGRNGSMDLNILIRTMLIRGKHFSFRTGAGIVADSVAEDEVTETRDKARGMLLAVGKHGVESGNA